jgi:nucleotide sugar dehydrogenase
VGNYRKKVCVQGLGFVGAAMAVAIAGARSKEGHLLYDVTGIDRDTSNGRERVCAIQEGRFPFTTADTALLQRLATSFREKNISATFDELAYETADVVVIDIALDIDFRQDQPLLDLSILEEAIRSVSSRVPEGCLLLVETTLPPGTCERVVAPILREELQKRGLGEFSVHLAHSFERVMPGHAYLESIVRFWRVYAGATDEAAAICREFLSTIVDVEEFPLTRLSSMTASETAKVMENTYRAVNIAFIDEWTKYAETVGIDLYEVIDAIQRRPTHSNIRFPGLGVGGYCLTKDPAFTPAATRHFFGKKDLEFPFSKLALRINPAMPMHTVSRLMNLMGCEITNRPILVLGVSYRQDIGDTRYSPVEILVKALEAEGADVVAFDPYVHYWQEMDRSLPSKMPDAKSFNAIVMAIPHREFLELNLVDWLDTARPIVIDAANITSRANRDHCRLLGIRIESIGRGDGL